MRQSSEEFLNNFIEFHEKFREPVRKLEKFFSKFLSNFREIRAERASSTIIRSVFIPIFAKLSLLLFYFFVPGHFLFIFDTSQRKRELNVTSPEIDPMYFDKNIEESCTLSLALNTYPKHTGNISVLIQEGNRTKVIANHLNIEDTG